MGAGQQQDMNLREAQVLVGADHGEYGVLPAVLGYAVRAGAAARGRVQPLHATLSAEEGLVKSPAVNALHTWATEETTLRSSGRLANMTD